MSYFGARSVEQANLMSGQIRLLDVLSTALLCLAFAARFDWSVGVGFCGF